MSVFNMKMKDKKAEQIAAKKLHREQLKAKRRSEPILERLVPTLLKKPTILIVCEGENTEPSYFSQFRLASATVKAVGEGYNTLSLVGRAIQLKEEGTYDQVWCVFDKYDFSDHDFNAAIVLARQSSMGVAFSNQAFEYWLLLHLEDHQGGGMHRDDYDGKLNQLLKPFGLTYDGKKSKRITQEIFRVLDGTDKKSNKDRKQLAISRAKRNYERHSHSNEAKKESSTTVYLLVEELLKYL